MEQTIAEAMGQESTQPEFIERILSDGTTMRYRPSINLSEKIEDEPFDETKRDYIKIILENKGYQVNISSCDKWKKGFQVNNSSDNTIEAIIDNFTTAALSIEGCSTITLVLRGPILYAHCGN